jgi:hypothetical protein
MDVDGWMDGWGYPGMDSWVILAGRFLSETWLMVALRCACPHTPKDKARDRACPSLDLSREPTRGNDYHTLPYTSKPYSLARLRTGQGNLSGKKDVIICSLF